MAEDNLQNANDQKALEPVSSGYSKDEISHLYELGRFTLENGELRRAESVFLGLNHVAPDFAPAWLGMAYIHIHDKNWDEAIHCSRQALRIQPDSNEAMLYLVACLLTTGDYNSAGTYLGEVGERIEIGQVSNSAVIRFFRAQLARFQTTI